MKKLAVITLLSALAVPAFAGDLYLVGSVGESKLDVKKNDIDSALVDVGVTNLSSSLDDKDTGYKLQVGYQFHPNFAVEGGYVNLGKAKYSAAFTGGSADAEVKAEGWNIDAVGILPLNEAFSLFAKVGAINAKVKVEAAASGPGGSANLADDSTKVKATWGVGGTYHFNKQIGLRVEYEEFNKLGDKDRTGEGDVRLLSAGVVFKF